jgi:Uma2 family endonuclease
MATLAICLPPNSELPIHSGRLGPIRSAEFETWPQENDNPYELIAGWVVPMSPGNLRTGRGLVDLVMMLGPHVRSRGWVMAVDARHRLPSPAESVVFPDIAIHCCQEIPTIPGTDTAARVPDVIVELLSEETAERDRAPHGAKFLAYQMSGVREYYYAWPDGRDAAGFRLHNGSFVEIAPDAGGFFRSPQLGLAFRVAPVPASEESV